LPALIYFFRLELVFVLGCVVLGCDRFVTAQRRQRSKTGIWAAGILPLSRDTRRQGKVYPISFASLSASLKNAIVAARQKLTPATG
ncbi:MAG: hypothetical protein K2N21_00205, partial [Rikenellaceae bacterium]|nr:hypothetical protein [Rikenellaceae bacterium]